MTQDNRRVQTAVLGSPDSDHPLSLPTDRREAALYLSRYRGARFFCGTHLGGCGWELMSKLYSDRVCHFAHHPDPKGLAPECERRYAGVDSADHLYIHRGLTSRLGSAQRFQGNLVDGRCTDLLVELYGRSAVRVQFVNLAPHVWEREDEALRTWLAHVDWMLGPRAGETAKYLVDRDGYALRVRCEAGSDTRVVKVGTETAQGDLEWVPLTDCEIDARGITTPLLRKLRKAAPRPARPAARDARRIDQKAQEDTAPAREPSPLLLPEPLIRHKLTSLIRDMREARRKGDYQRILHAVDTNAALLAALTRRTFRKEREAVDELKRWAVVKQDNQVQIESDIRRRSAALVKTIVQALAEGDLTAAQRDVEALRKTLQRVPRRIPDFEAEVQDLRECESRLRAAQERAARNQAAKVHAARVKEKRDQLHDILARIEKAEAVGDYKEVRRLYQEGRFVLKRLGPDATSDERWRLDSIQRMLDSTLVNRITEVLKNVARNQATISIQGLAEDVGAEGTLSTITFIEVDRSARTTGPILSALVTTSDGRVLPDFRTVLEGLGYEVPKTDRALDIIWRREVERAHACYGDPPRDMPPSHVPRAQSG